jgi:hypothetical protein
LQEIWKGGSTIPRIIENPVKDRASWEKLKTERLNPDDPLRFPDNWEDLARKYNEGDKIIQLGWFPYGLFGTLRDMMGVEELLVAFYDDPALIHWRDGATTTRGDICRKSPCVHTRIPRCPLPGTALPRNTAGNIIIITAPLQD